MSSYFRNPLDCSGFTRNALLGGSVFTFGRNTREQLTPRFELWIFSTFEPDRFSIGWAVFLASFVHGRLSTLQRSGGRHRLGSHHSRFCSAIRPNFRLRLPRRCRRGASENLDWTGCSDRLEARWKSGLAASGSRGR